MSAKPSTAHFDFLFTTTIDGRTAREIIASTIREASDRYEARRAGNPVAARRIDEITDLVDRAVADDSIGLLGHPEVDVEIGRAGEMFAVRIPINGDAQEAAEVAALFRAAGGQLADAVSDVSGIGFRLREREVADLGEALARATAISVDQVAHTRAARAAAEAADSAFANELGGVI